MLALHIVSFAALEVDFNAGWRFHRGDGTYQLPSSDDTDWRDVEAPHDWAIEDLPSREEDDVTPVLAVRHGIWRFYRGEGNDTFAAPGFDDAGWTDIQVPSDWRAAAGYEAANASGWYRRNFTVSAAAFAAARAGTLRLALGSVATADRTYINGAKVGSTGAWHKPGGCSSRLDYRSYAVPASALHVGPDNVAAIWVWSEGSGPAGLVDWAQPDRRIGPFDPGASPGHKQTGYTLGGVGWYRKTFRPDASWGERLQLFVEGCYMNCSVYLNGEHLLTHPYGYTSFAVDLTAGGLRLGQPNVLAIRAESRGSNSRWYAGAGLFRPVSLLAHPALHLAVPGGVYVTTPHIALTASDGLRADATVAVNVTVANARGTTAAGAGARVELFDERGVSLGVGFASLPEVGGGGGSASVLLSFDVRGVRTWSPGQPSLYRAVATLSCGGGLRDGCPDTETATFGVRSFSFDSSAGFVLNGQSVKLHGGCVHHDNGPLGSKAIGRAEERRVELLKANGYNAIRTSHNPASRAFVDACNRLGVLLMEEAFDCWDAGKNSDDYHLFFEDWWQRDIASMVLRDRNAPAIVFWSIGNEIPNRHVARGAALSAALSEYIRHLDDAGGGSRRAITSAYPGVGTDAATAAFLAPLDVAGYNYSPHGFARDHVTHPARVIAATETFPESSVLNFNALQDYPWVVGTFIWTAIDYIGESSIGANGHSPPDPLACGGYCPAPWSYHISFCGDLDIVGGQKPQAYLRRVLWNVSALEMAVKPADDGEVIASWGFPDERQSWSWEEQKRLMRVNLYSTRCACVLLALNGRNVSEGCVNVSRATAYTATVRVPYEPGTLEATGFDARGRAIATRTFKTSGPAAKLRLAADRTTIRPSRADLSYVTVEVVDADGVLVACANESSLAACVPPTVRFKLEGAGEITAVGSGDPTDASSFHQLARKTFRGRATAIIRPGSPSAAPPRSGKLTLTASSAGLASATLTIELRGGEVVS